MRIDKEQFNELYPQLFEYRDIFYREHKDDNDFIENHLSSKLWRMNNLYTIVDKDGDRIQFEMNYSQHRVYAASLIHPRLIILKSRQQGISTFWLINFFDDAMFETDFNIGLMAQGKEEAATLLERVKLAWETLDDSIKQFLNISLDKDNATEFSFSNNSTIFIRVSFRSATLQRLHISELGKIANQSPKRAKETNTGTLQAIKPGNVVAIESTAEGDNMFKHKWDAAIAHTGKLAGKDLMPIFLSWLDDPDCVSNVHQVLTKEQEEYFFKLEDELGRKIAVEQKWFWVMQYRELGDDIYQEYPSTPEEAFSAARDGTYYAKKYKAQVTDKEREVEGLFDKNIDVDVVMDLGVNDDFVLGFWQEYDGTERCVHAYHNTGEGLEHYVNYINDWSEANGAHIGWLIGPHDLKVKELGTGMTRKKRLRELGVRRLRVLPKIGVNDGIEAVRRMLPYIWIDKVEAEYVIKGFKNYSKEWDDIREVWKDKPFHDEWSHPMDMVRYRAIANKRYYTPHTKDKVVEKRKRKGKTNVVDGLAL